MANQAQLRADVRPRSRSLTGSLTRRPLTEESHTTIVLVDLRAAQDFSQNAGEDPDAFAWRRAHLSRRFFACDDRAKRAVVVADPCELLLLDRVPVRYSSGVWGRSRRGTSSWRTETRCNLLFASCEAVYKVRSHPARASNCGERQPSSGESESPSRADVPLSLYSHAAALEWRSNS